MLVLSRKLGERIVIGLPGGRIVEVTVVEIDRGKVRLGIEAPSDLSVYRREVWEKIVLGVPKSEVGSQRSAARLRPPASDL